MLTNYDLIVFDSTIQKPEVANSGYSLDFFSPKDLWLVPGAFIEIKSGFGLNIPQPYLGLMLAKASLSYPFIVGPGQLIYPNCKKELTINLTYTGISEVNIKKNEPLFQVTMLHGVAFL